MKKTLLLAGVASVLACQAQAGYWSDVYNEMHPYIGADYVYSYAKFGGPAKHMRESYHSPSVNIGARMYGYYGLEAFYQQSFKEKRKLNNENHSAEFLAYGADMYGYMPVMCSQFNLLGSLGLANYRFDFRYPDIASKSQNRIGYRAGVGMQYDFNEHFAFRMMGRYTYLGMNRVNNLKEVTAGFRYMF
ncbi:MAG: porin family protein [Alphaproteobacteria bacterium]|nr:porin family protein [Alphaproteobacteria bacterium]